ncbi:ferric reductase-like transmembrane domain-containing protein [Paraclostridium bifermentans]|uniref:ferric reductase-like transmembrane domain-containing protein n=1 Tax=Paraclostridium bifermentans TaxID=1490 RepID=UPI0034DE4BA5
MLLTYSLIFTIVVSLFCTSSIKKHSNLYYIIALTIALLTSYINLYGETYNIELQGLLLASYKSSMKGILSVSFFIIVMFTGALDRKYAITKKLLSVRAQLAIIGSILILPHGLIYTYFIFGDFVKSLTLPGLSMIHLTIGLVAFLVMIPLFITSFKFVRIKMKYVKWKKIQRWSYLFYGLTYLHVALILLNKDNVDILKIVIYSTIFIVYTILRIMKCFNEKKVKSMKVSSV